MSELDANVTLRQVRGFLLAAELLSFTRAAEAMHLSQSAFSQLVRELEGTLGVRLFDRTTRRVTPTDAGLALEERMRRGVREIDEACTQARAIARGEHGRLVVGTLPSLAIGVVARALGDLRRSHPGIKVALREDHNGALIERVAQGECDFAVCAQGTGMKELVFDALFDDELVAVVREDDPLAARATIRWNRLAETPLVMTVRHSSTRERIVEALAANGIEREIDYDVGNMFTALGMVREGFGITFVPALTLADCDLRGLASRRLLRPTPYRRIGLCRHRDRSVSPAAKRFDGLLREHVTRALRRRERRAPAGP